MDVIAGDHIAVRRVGYSHHGIYMGDDSVIHFSGEPGSKSAAAIIRSPLDEFECGGVSRVVRYGQRLDPQQTVERAASRVGEVGYNLVFNNCEHFARWCVTGEAASEQVRSATNGAAASVLTAASATGGVAGATALGVAGVSGPGVMSAMATAGSLVGGGAAFGPAVIAVVPALAGVSIMNLALRDDPSFCDDDRDARRDGRIASGVASAGALVATPTAISFAGTTAGLSAAGISSGLAAIGGVAGGGMVAGVAILAAAPVAAAALAGAGVYFVSKGLRGQRPAASHDGTQPSDRQDATQEPGVAAEHQQLEEATTNDAPTETASGIPRQQVGGCTYIRSMEAEESSDGGLGPNAPRSGYPHG